MVTKLEHFNGTNNFEIKHKFIRCTQEAENVNSLFCAWHPPGLNTLIPHKIQGARGTDMNIKCKLPTVT